MQGYTFSLRPRDSLVFRAPPIPFNSKEEEDLRPPPLPLDHQKSELQLDGSASVERPLKFQRLQIVFVRTAEAKINILVYGC